MRLTKAIFLIPILCCIVFYLTPAKASQFKLKNVTDKAAVCNNGEVANYWVSEQGTNKWLIQLPGGGAAWSAKVYAKRGENKKSQQKGKPNLYPTQQLQNNFMVLATTF